MLTKAYLDAKGNISMGFDPRVVADFCSTALPLKRDLELAYYINKQASKYVIIVYKGFMCEMVKAYWGKCQNMRLLFIRIYNLYMTELGKHRIFRYHFFIEHIRVAKQNMPIPTTRCFLVYNAVTVKMC